MLFYSFPFLYLFLPVVIVLFYLISMRSRRLGLAWLVASSLFFYGWWNHAHVALITGSILFNFGAGYYLRANKSRAVLIVSIAVNLLLIGYFKYAGFFADIVNSLADLQIDIGPIALPLAISFFTFQQIAWLVDNYAGLIDTHRRSFLDYALFVLFFPQLIAGPIVHHSEMMPQFRRENQRVFQWPNFSAGVAIFIIGLAKKVVIADNVAPVANAVFDGVAFTQTVGSAEAWSGALAYTVQLYFDFSGYADMAIGLALMLNIRLPVNFNSPYKALSIADFWRRWHMTLSRFLRDYLYIPLGGNRKGPAKRYQFLLITMLIGGLWHGASWNFVLWGGLHGVFLVINHWWESLSRWRLPAVISWLVTFLCVVFAWVFFRAHNIDTAMVIVSSMVLFQPDTGLLEGTSVWVLGLISAALLAAFLLPNSQQLTESKAPGVEVYRGKESVSEEREAKPFQLVSLKWSLIWLVYLVALALVSVFTLLDTSSVSEFIYFRF